MQYRNIQIYFCNIRMKHLQYYSKTFETREIYTYNMQQTLSKRVALHAWSKSRGARCRGARVVGRACRRGSSLGLVRRRHGALRTPPRSFVAGCAVGKANSSSGADCATGRTSSSFVGRRTRAWREKASRETQARRTRWWVSA